MNKSERTHIPELHGEVQNWQSELAYIKDELKSLENKLQEVSRRNNGAEVSAQMEHFQNQFIHQNTVSDELSQKLQEVGHRLSREAQTNPVASDHRLVADEPSLREQVSTHMELFRNLRNEFHDFAGRWL